MAEDEARRKIERPALGCEEARALAESLYGLDVVKVKEMDSYDDRNFYLRVREALPTGAGNGAEAPHREYTLKVHNGVESTDGIGVVRCQDEALKYLSARGVCCPEPVPVPLELGGEAGEWAGRSIAFHTLALQDGSGDRAHAVRLLTFVPGTLLCDVPPPWPGGMLRSVGAAVGRMDSLLLGFSHPGAARVLLWDLAHLPKLRAFVPCVERAGGGAGRLPLLERAFAIFEEEVGPAMRAALDAEAEAAAGAGAGAPASSPLLRRATIHNDPNDHNVLMRPSAPSEVAGIIDFGDTVHSFLVCNIAIGLAYMALDKPDGAAVLSTTCAVLEGYTSVLPLNAAEVACVFPLMCARLAQSVTMSSYSFAQDPTNEYLLVTQKPGWAALAQMLELDRAEVDAAIQRACAGGAAGGSAGAGGAPGGAAPSTTGGTPGGGDWSID